MSGPLAITGGAALRPPGAELPDVPPPVGERVARVERLSALALAAASATLEDAGCGDASGRERTAVVFGTALGCLLTNGEYQRRFARGGPAAASPRLFAATVSNAAAGEVGIAFRLRGPGVTLTAGRAAGSVALGHAAETIAAGRADAALAGGIDAAGALVWEWIEAGGLAVNGRPADAAALLLLEPPALAHGRGARVRGLLRGHAAGFEPAPEAADAGHGLAGAIALALRRAAVSPDAIRVVLSASPPALAALEGRALAGVLGRPCTPWHAAGEGEALGASGPQLVWHLLRHEPAGTIALVIDACGSGHVAALVVETGAPR